MAVSSLEQIKSRSDSYDHAAWESRRKFLRFLLRTLAFTLLARVDRVEGMENVPAEGSGILLINHIAFIDPIVIVHLLPRNIVPLAKVEVYDYPLVGIFPQMWGVIPVKRDEVDRQAIQRCLDVLRAGEILLMAPEGTRNQALQNAREGIAYLASRAGSPIIPVAIEGTEGFPTFRYSKRWRQPGAHIRFGQPFRYRPSIVRPRQPMLRQMTDEAMYVLASMLPEHRRGVYSDLSKATQDTIEWF